MTDGATGVEDFHGPVRVSEPPGTASLAWGEILRDVIGSREIAWALAAREIKVRYKHSILGIGWALFAPLVATVIFTLVFTRAINLDTGDVPYPLFAYIGLVPWTFFATGLLKATESLRQHSNLVTRVYFPREALPISCILSSLVDCVVAAFLVACMMAFYGRAPRVGVIALPLVFAAQLALMTGLGLLFAAGNMFFRDVGLIIQVIIPLWMWASSVAYPIPDTGMFRWLNLINPMTPILNAYRDLILRGTLSAPWSLLTAAAISFLIAGLALRLFHSWEFKFGELT